MKSRAALLHAVGHDWQVEEIEVDAHKAGEVVVEWKAAGRYALDEINAGYQAMRDGENIRGVIVHG
jgi:Zn-dependent alcohol dehydrogenase